jgi:DNA-binding NtrC family response regulator
MVPRDAHEDIRLATVVLAPALITAASRELRTLCARWIHISGRRAPGPFVAVSGASTHPAGLRRYFERAWGGTLFVEDLAALDAAAQNALLALVEKQAHPRGDTPCRARVIAGASRHLNVERASGAFSDALFYRLNVVHINLMVHAGKYARV